MNEWVLLAIFTGVALLGCVVGFKKFVWFLSIGYGFSVALLGIAYLVWGIVKGTWDYISIIQCVLFVAYGARLSGFLLARELKSASYKKVLTEVTKNTTEKKVPVFVSVTVWLMVGILYVMQTSPMFYRMLNGDLVSGGYTAASAILPLVGVGVSVIGIVLETIADFQKTAQKKINSNMVATKGLYRMVRCPNYLGEILFWTGAMVGVTASLRANWWQWLIVIFGWICIVYIMINGAQRLDRRQEKNYGNNEEYRKYADHTPIIFPLLPIYHIGAYKVEDMEAIKAKKEAKKAAKGK